MRRPLSRLLRPRHLRVRALRCNSCMAAIGFGVKFFGCNVSTCNRKRTDLVSRSVACWHAPPTVRHRDGWAVGRIALRKGE